MANFTIETTYRLPVFRQHTYDAASLEEACQLAVEDDDWSDQKEDSDSAGATYVFAAWPGKDTAYRVSPLTIPSEFAEKMHRQAEHFETLLGILKILVHGPGGEGSNLSYLRERAEAAIARAEAILAGTRDPD